MVTLLLVVPVALLAAQVSVCAAVSVMIEVALQPISDVSVCAELTVQLTATLLVYQPLLPIVPLTVEVTVGGAKLVAPGVSRYA